jgi:hypothetical protein
MVRLDAMDWKLACEDEKRALERMEAYEVVPRPNNWRVARSKWILHISRGPDGDIQRYKARVVTHEFTQVEEVGHDDAIIAPTASIATITEHDLKSHLMNIESAHLDKEPREEIFMEAPPGFDIPEGTAL